MVAPSARGPLSDRILDRLGHGEAVTPSDVEAASARLAEIDPLADEDLHLALAVCYELHYRGIDGVDDAREWDLGVLAWRRQLEHGFEDALHKAVDRPATVEEPIERVLRQIVDEDDGPSLAAHLARHGTLGQYRELLQQRSVYHLKEADPHTWAIPRLEGRTKAALVEIQADEYGGGDPARIARGALRAGHARPAPRESISIIAR